jgi:hypothetical protein
LDFTAYFEWLTEKLEPLYTPPRVLGGHDLTHVRGMERLGGKILPHLPDVSVEEYRVTVWLHDLDRCPALRQEIADAGGLSNHLANLLDESPFNQSERARITDAVLRHGKKCDEPDDSGLLLALRVADKLDRLTPLNIMSGPAHRSDIPHYDAEAPFDYRKNKPNHLKYFLWNVEWYGMLPTDWAREIVDEEFFYHFLQFIRDVGRDIAERLGIENKIEEELKLALGKYYVEFA